MAEALAKDPRYKLRCWLEKNPQGLVLQELEAAYLRSAVSLGHGKNLVQLGVNRGIFEASSVWVIDPWELSAEFSGLQQVRAEFTHLPLANDSVDELVLSHILEFAKDRHQVLREVERVLKPEGRLHILGFNPYNVFCRWRPIDGFVSRNRIMDWLSLLKFTAEWKAGLSIALKGIFLPSHSLRDHIIASFATVYAILAIKRTYRYIPLHAPQKLSPQLMPQGMVGASSRTRHP